MSTPVHGSGEYDLMAFDALEKMEQAEKAVRALFGDTRKGRPILDNQTGGTLSELLARNETLQRALESLDEKAEHFREIKHKQSEGGRKGAAIANQNRG